MPAAAAKRTSVVISSLLVCIILYLVEQVLAVDYLTKTAVKIALFTLIPWACSRLGSPVKSGVARCSVKPGLMFGLAAGLIILITYGCLRDRLNLPAIATELQEKARITPANFPLVALYITFGNSFLEEFFFRGFIFFSLLEQGSPIFAHAYSSILFAVYHVAIFQSWFNPWLIGLALIGLVSISLVLNWLNVQSGRFWNSWITHILADTAIILIGMRMFKLV